MRSVAMQSLTNDIQSEYPGVTIWGKGDQAHQEHPSDHNEDDTPGSKPAETDSDTKPEHRAIDVNIDGVAFTHSDAEVVIDDVISKPENRARLKYINYKDEQWNERDGWHDNSDDPHPTHIHFSGKASTDEDGRPWLSGGSGGEMQARLGDKGDVVIRLQEKLLFVRPDAATSDPILKVDGDYGQKTATWVSRVLTGGPGDYVSPSWFDRLNELVLDQKIIDAGGGPGGLVPHTHTVPNLSVSVSGSGSTGGATTGEAVQS